MLSSYKVEKVTGDSQPAVPVCDLKNQVSLTDSSYDEMLEAFEISARQYVEKATGRILTDCTYRLYLDDFPDEEFYFPHGPVVTITSIEYLVNGAWTSVSSDIYRLGAGEIVSQGIVKVADKSWPSDLDSEMESVRINYSVGAENKIGNQIIKLLVAHWFENREASSMGAMNKVPFAVDTLISSIKSYNVR